MNGMDQDRRKRAVARAILSGAASMLARAEQAGLVELKLALTALNEAAQRTLATDEPASLTETETETRVSPRR